MFVNLPIVNNLNSIILFDVDGTLAISTKEIDNKMFNELHRLYDKGHNLGIVGGGNIQKICQQIGLAKKYFKYIFAENGITSYEMINGEMKQFHENKLDWSQELLSQICNFLLELVGDINGNINKYVVFRNGMLYFTPIGSNCTWNERLDFVEFDKVNKIRKTMINKILERFFNNNIDAKLGGMIGIGIHPIGWDKTYVLKFLEQYEIIYYFGDQYLSDGNDYPLLSHDRVTGIKVDNPEQTLELLKYF